MFHSFFTFQSFIFSVLFFIKFLFIFQDSSVFINVVHAHLPEYFSLFGY